MFLVQDKTRCIKSQAQRLENKADELITVHWLTLDGT